MNDTDKRKKKLDYKQIRGDKKSERRIWVICHPSTTRNRVAGKLFLAVVEEIKLMDDKKVTLRS